jgi:uncharacterized cupin superfamily protein
MVPMYACNTNCEIPHISNIISGRVKTVMDDGTEVESGSGSVGIVEPGHNTWVKQICIVEPDF